jgi:predicted nucleic acid-binding protein
MRCLSIDNETGLEAGRILRHFRVSHGLALGDSLIAATAIQNELQVWTRNRKHFPDSRNRFFTPSTIEA